MKKIALLILITISLTVSAQKLELSATTVNFGNIPMKPKSEKTFTIYNKGAQPIVIKAINIDCNCTKLEWKKNPIKTGDSTVVKVIFIPDEKGVFYKKATILSTIGNQEVIIRGTVK